MIAGGLEFEVSCASEKMNELFSSFKSLYEQERTIQNNTKATVVSGSHSLILSRQSWVNNSDWITAYSRTTKMDNGKWVTVQIRKWEGFYGRLTMEIFGDHANSLASATISNCGEGLGVSMEELQQGKNTIIQGALRAVTGKDYEVVVSDK